MEIGLHSHKYHCIWFVRLHYILSSGALIRNGSLTSEITTLDIQDLQEGIYFIQLGDNIQQSFKIIKQ